MQKELDRKIKEVTCTTVRSLGFFSSDMSHNNICITWTTVYAFLNSEKHVVRGGNLYKHKQGYFQISKHIGIVYAMMVIFVMPGRHLPVHTHFVVIGIDNKHLILNFLIKPTTLTQCLNRCSKVLLRQYHSQLQIGS